MKMPGPEGVIIVYGDQNEAQMLKIGMALGQRHINVVERYEDKPSLVELPTTPKYNLKVKPQEGTKEVVLCTDGPKETIWIC